MVLELFRDALLLPLCGGALISLMIEQGLRPAPRLLGRSLRAYAAHLGVWTLAFAVVLGVTQRPWFAALLVLAELVFVVLVSNAKQRSLREPFVFADIEYFIDALRHPRLFLPYMGVWRAVVAIGVFAGVLYIGFVLEPALPARTGYALFSCMVTALLAAGAGLLWLSLSRPPEMTFDAGDDLRRCGLPACLWYYAVAERRPVEVAVHSPFVRTRAFPAAEQLPHLVVIQSESFFDVRRLYPDIRPQVLEQFDAMRQVALRHGLLRVPAWGGNTTRSEFAFLSGLGSAELGVHRFNPHRRLARQPLPSLAGFLKSAGYRTVCVHPYPAGFNSRDVVYPAMGFDAFVDLADFTGAGRCGPYVSDQAVADRVCAMLAEATQPLLLFVITMENHGPLHLERPAPGDVERLYATPPPAGFDDLTVYLRHLANADRMIGTLTACLDRTPRDGLLCWYGDHVPILPGVYQRAGFVDGRTDFFIWRKGAAARAAQVDLCVEDLGGMLLDHAGFR
jgi:phosphoglycerol transferase MdoB-like AlkP superfamily enzyme